MTKSLSNEQQQRLQQWRQALQAEWELRSEKLKRLRIDCAIEASTAVKFQLEKQIEYEQAKLKDIERQLNDYDGINNHNFNILNTFDVVALLVNPIACN